MARYTARRSSSLPRLISLPDAARTLNVTASRLYSIVKGRRVSHMSWPGNSCVKTNIFFREADLERLLETLTVHAKKKAEAPPEPAMPRGLSSVEECEYLGVEPDPEFQNVDVRRRTR